MKEILPQLFVVCEGARIPGRGGHQSQIVDRGGHCFAERVGYDLLRVSRQRDSTWARNSVPGCTAAEAECVLSRREEQPLEGLPQFQRRQALAVERNKGPRARPHFHNE